ncbi:2544_t:CDS:2, partial [Funneliformis caledonium]
DLRKHNLVRNQLGNIVIIDWGYSIKLEENHNFAFAEALVDLTCLVRSFYLMLYKPLLDRIPFDKGDDIKSRAQMMLNFWMGCRRSDVWDSIYNEACDKCSEVISKVPLLRLNASVSKPVVLLPCRHKTYFECISNKSKLCPKCLSIDDLEKEEYYISPTFDEASKKRKRKDDSHKSSRDTKAQTIICELSICPASEVSISAPPEDSDMRKVSNQFHKLYYEIDDTEKNGDRTNRDLVRFYFRFGKALSERLAILLQSNPSQTAHTKLNKEVKKKLLKNTNNGM